MFLITEILIIYYHYTKNVRILVCSFRLQSQADGIFSDIITFLCRQTRYNRHLHLAITVRENVCNNSKKT